MYVRSHESILHAVDMTAKGYFKPLQVVSYKNSQIFVPLASV